MNSYKVTVHNRINGDSETRDVTAPEPIDAARHAATFYAISLGRHLPQHSMDECRNTAELNDMLIERFMKVDEPQFTGTRYCLDPRPNRPDSVPTFTRVSSKNLSQSVAVEVINREPEFIEVRKAFGTKTDDGALRSSGRDLTVIVMGNTKIELSQPQRDELNEWMHRVLRSSHIK